MKKNRIVHILFLACIFLTGCVRNDIVDDRQGDVTFPQEEYAIFIGQKLDLIPQYVDYQNKSASSTYSWVSTADSVVEVSNTGQVTGLKVGSSVILASVDERDKKISAKTVVRVMDGTRIEVTPSSILLLVDDTQQLSAKYYTHSGELQSSTVFTYTSNSTTTVRVNSTGLLTALTSGQAIITISANGITQEVLVNVMDRAQKGVQFKNSSNMVVSSASVKLNETKEPIAELVDENGEVVNGAMFTWESSEQSVATVNSSTGVITPVALGQTIITAISAGANSGIQGSFMLTVISDANASELARVELKRDGVVCSAATIAPNETLQYDVIAYDGNDNRITDNVTFKWASLSSDGTSNAFGTISSTGLFTAQGEGETQITVTASQNGNEFNSLPCDVSIDYQLARIDVLLNGTVCSGTNALTLGDMDQYTAKAYNVDGEEITGITNFTWIVSDGSIGTISNSGQFTASGIGTTSVSVLFNGFLSSSCNIMVSAPMVLSRTGDFFGVEGQSASGGVMVSESNGVLTVTFASNFTVDRGPSLFVYLSNTTVASDFHGSDLELGGLQSTSGTQTYTVNNVDLYDYNVVYVHCKPYDHTFGQANLSTTK